MAKLAHWTQRSVSDFVYSISSTFVAQLESRMEAENIKQSELAVLLQKSESRVSQVFNNPGNLSLRVIVEHAQALGMKVSIVAYDDSDPTNESGPINPEVFVKSWEKINRPRDLFHVSEAVCISIPIASDRTLEPTINPPQLWGGVTEPPSLTKQAGDVNLQHYPHFLQEPQYARAN